MERARTFKKPVDLVEKHTTSTTAGLRAGLQQKQNTERTGWLEGCKPTICLSINARITVGMKSKGGLQNASLEQRGWQYCQGNTIKAKQHS